MTGKWGGTLHKVFSTRARGDTWYEKETPMGAIYASFYMELMGAKTKKAIGPTGERLHNASIPENQGRETRKDQNKVSGR